MMRRLFFIIIVLTLIPGQSARSGGKGSVFDSKHNLSTSGKGDIKSPTETRVCIFCHSSHNTSKEGPLWNHQTTTQKTFSTYKRSTMSSQPEQPNGATKLCLSCHDGTIAVGAVRGLSRPITMQNVGAGGEIPANRKGNFGLDLSGTHPVSVKYKQSTALAVKHLRWPPLDPEKIVGPDADGYVQCTSCHDPHDDSKSDRYPFWKKTTFDEVCLTCHTF
jgi:hypothetical protein